MTDGLIKVIGESCKPLMSDDVWAGFPHADRYLVYSWQDLGRPQNFTDCDLRVHGQHMHQGLGVRYFYSVRISISLVILSEIFI